MTKNTRPIVQGIIVSRQNLIEFVVVAVLLAFGVDLVAGHILALAALSSRLALVVGVILCLGSVLYLAVRLFGRRVERRTYEAFLVYDKKRNKIITVPRYEFSEAICRYMSAAFAENSALKLLWDKEPLKDFLGDEPREAAQLLSQATEYFVLAQLSTHLTDYFADEKFKKQNLRKYCREDVPEVLLRNTFLEMFSRPMEHRPAFVEAHSGKRERMEMKVYGPDERGMWRSRYVVPTERGYGEVVAAYGPGGVIYDRFDLILPQGSVVRRVEDSKVEIETKKLKMSINVKFEGFCTVLPEGFEEYYLGINDPLKGITPYVVNVDIQVSMKLGSLLSATGWQYYRWIDSFLDKIEKDLSKDTFFELLNWESAFTILQCLKQAQQRKVKSKEE